MADLSIKSISSQFTADQMQTDRNAYALCDMNKENHHLMSDMKNSYPWEWCRWYKYTKFIKVSKPIYKMHVERLLG